MPHAARSALPGSPCCSSCCVQALDCCLAEAASPGSASSRTTAAIRRKWLEERLRNQQLQAEAAARAQYEVVVATSSVKGAGTDARVYINITGCDELSNTGGALAEAAVSCVPALSLLSAAMQQCSAASCAPQAVQHGPNSCIDSSAAVLRPAVQSMPERSRAGGGCCSAAAPPCRRHEAGGPQLQRACLSAWVGQQLCGGLCKRGATCARQGVARQQRAPP